MTSVFSLLLLSTSICSCNKSYKEKKQEEKLSREELLREDSLALKVATVPTLDCLPLFIGVEDSLFKKNGVDVMVTGSAYFKAADRAAFVKIIQE